MSDTPTTPATPTPPSLPSTAWPCPRCRSERLYVERTVGPCVGLIVRYRACERCGYKLITEEKPQRPKGAARFVSDVGNESGDSLPATPRPGSDGVGFGENPPVPG